jgi:hypothetical protein
MSWYRLKKKANAQLGMNLGKWLVLESQGQRNEASVKNDIMSYVAQNPMGIDTAAARSSAINFFVNQTKQQPTPDMTALLDQWLSMVEGSSISPSVDDSLAGDMGNETEVTF